jgi:hypothetical protein
VLGKTDGREVTARASPYDQDLAGLMIWLCHRRSPLPLEGPS